jgi:hypothetical protein
MGEIITAGGSGYLMPVVLFVLVLYAARGMFGLHGRRSQQRKEFLEFWNSLRVQDDLWLEASVRHLFGTWLPAPIIRLALRQPDRGQSLTELSELWPLLQFDRKFHNVRWLHRRHHTPKQRKFARFLVLAAYFLSALASVFAAKLAYQSGPTTFSAWLYGIGALVGGAAALVCLAREDTMKIAVRVGEEWVSRINETAGGQ